jgi:hypothetical protein
VANTLSLNDLWRAWLTSQLTPGLVAGTSQPLSGYPDSVYGGGNLTSPGANALITGATTGALTPGTYHVTVRVGFGGTVEGTAINNFRLVKVNGGSPTTLYDKLQVQHAANQAPVPHEFTVTTVAGDSLEVRSVVGADVGAVYIASINARRIG